MMETIKSPVSDRHGNLIGILGIGRDITQRKDYENRLHRLSQFYAALSQCNETIIRSSDENELLQEICRISVQITQIKAAWVGFIDKNDGILRWVAGSGEGNEESTSANNAFGDKNDVLNSPFYQAIKMGQAIWFQDLHSDELNESFREMAKAHNYQSAASLPLHREGAVVGVLNLYANVEQAFDEDVRQLLSEMAVDISFALDNFILEEHRITSEKSLLESEQRFRGLVEQSLSGIYIIQDGKYVYANPRLAEILGFTSENDLVGKSITHFIVPEDRDTVTTQLHNLMNRKSSHIAFEARVKRSDGELVDIGVHGALASHLGRPAAIGLVQDVTDKKRAEEQLNTYVEKLQASLMQTVEVANILSEMRDPYTSGHERRVAEIAVAIGRELELDEQQLEGLRVAGYLHDIGKINIPSEILAKPSKLTELEYEIIKGHPEAGFNVLKDVDFPWPVAQVARHHHERINGSGYPDGLKGDEIILEAKITAVADVVEAMGSHRPYRPGLGIEPALEEIERGKGTLYDPRVAEACLRLFREKGYSLPD
jgi:PAS domain S-box-containing protein/putative nucleotidyltransferase with HDIG domain